MTFCIEEYSVITSCSKWHRVPSAWDARETLYTEPYEFSREQMERDEFVHDTEFVRPCVKNKTSADHISMKPNQRVYA
jgi:hypothetical protein